MKTNEVTVPETILAQLGGNRALFMVGGTGTAVGGENSLHFAIKGSPSKANKVRIVLEADDTYTIELWAGRSANVRRLSATAGVMVAKLRETFEILTGLRLSLGTCGR